MSDVNNENIENNQEENQNKYEDKKSCWVKTQPTNSSDNHVEGNSGSNTYQGKGGNDYFYDPAGER